MGKREVLIRENRLKALTQVAVEQLRQGVDELEVEEALKRMALENWGVSPATMYNYAAAALARAKKQLGLGGEQNVAGGKA